MVWWVTLILKKVVGITSTWGGAGVTLTLIELVMATMSVVCITRDLEKFKRLTAVASHDRLSFHCGKLD
jgi:hypothetical protein